MGHLRLLVRTLLIPVAFGLGWIGTWVYGGAPAPWAAGDEEQNGERQDSPTGEGLGLDDPAAETEPSADSPEPPSGR